MIYVLLSAITGLQLFTIHKLQNLKRKEDKILNKIEELSAALDTIAQATTDQGAVLAGEAGTLQTISDEMDALLATPGIPDDVVAKAQALAAKVGSVSTTIQANADFSKALASKGAANPVPVPVPAPTP